MLGEGSAHVCLDDFGDRVRAELAAVRVQCALVRGDCAQVQRRATVVREESMRIRADSRRARGEVLRAPLPRDATCGAVARRLVELHLHAAGDEMADAKTVVSELATNAFLHGTGRIELRVSCRRGRARIEVIDEGRGVAIQARRSDGRHGLYIVDGLSLTWGAANGSTRVWAELPARGACDQSPLDSSFTRGA